MDTRTFIPTDSPPRLGPLTSLNIWVLAKPLPIIRASTLRSTITIGADDWPDVTAPYNTDTLIWADASGTSAAISKTISDIYTENASFSAGDSVVFNGTLVSDTLASPYKENAIIFIKDYDTSWGFHGIYSVNISTLTNGQVFSVTLPSVFGSGDHVQYGMEWAGPPVRSANAASYGSAMISTNGGVITPPGNVYVGIDPSQQWAGFRNVIDQFGVNYGPASGYIGVGGQTPQFQGTISSQGIVQCAPDISLDINFHTDPNIWADGSGVSSAVATYDNTFYVDSTSTGARAGDTIVFSGTLVTNALTDSGMASTLVAFIKDFGSDWSYYGEQSVTLASLTNGQTFTITKPVNSAGDHVQWGFEWQGVPARTNPAAANFVGQYGYVIFSSNSVVTAGPQILSINPSSANILLGSNATFTANATGSGLTYHWFKNGVSLTDGGGISGSGSSTLNLTGVQPAQEGTYITWWSRIPALFRPRTPLRWWFIIRVGFTLIVLWRPSTVLLTSGTAAILFRLLHPAAQPAPVPKPARVLAWPPPCCGPP